VEFSFRERTERERWNSSTVRGDAAGDDVCSRRRHPTPTDAVPSPPPPPLVPPPGRCWSGPSLRSLGVVAAAAERDEHLVTSDEAAAAGGGGGVDASGGDGDGGVAGDVELLPKPTHRGYGSLQKVYPHRTTHDVDRLRLFDAAVDIFLECVAGTRDLTRMNSQTFRSFVRSVSQSGSLSNLPRNAMLKGKVLS